MGSASVYLRLGSIAGGSGRYGELGDGTYYTDEHGGSALPVAVKGSAKPALLGGVASLSSDGGGHPVGSEKKLEVVSLEGVVGEK